MRRLLKADFKRFLTDKLFMIGCFVGLGLVFITPLLLQSLESLMGAIEEGVEITDLINARTFYFEAFSPMSDFGIVLAIFLAIIINRDFSYGTIRNKIINGHKRRNIYLSLFIVTFTIMAGLMLAYAFTTLGIGTLLTNYFRAYNIGKEILLIFLSVIFAAFFFVTITAILVFFSLAFKNVGVSIVLYLVMGFVFSIIYTVATVGNAALESVDANTAIEYIFNFLTYINPFAQLQLLGNILELKLYEVVFIIFSQLAVIAIFLFGGIATFNKRNLK
ncbi:MAG: ABC transporter permease subunit [Acholeplasmatales bacterium]|nr:ABC transporter permease subunit [Acholeplasmatales bacterium]